MYMFLFQILTFFVTFREMHWSFFHSLNNLVEKKQNIKKNGNYTNTPYLYILLILFTVVHLAITLSIYLYMIEH